MNIEQRLALSYYKEIAVLNEAHKIYLVQHLESKKIYVKKILDVYNSGIYAYLLANPIPGTPQIIQLFEDDGKLTVIEEYVSGKTLEEVLEESGPLDIRTACQYIYRLCSIVTTLHHCSPAIIHRDIKPSNIILTSAGPLYLLDFNAAKRFSTETEDTVLLGTHGFAAPEQYGFGASSVQTDIYAIGMLLKTLVGENYVAMNPDYAMFMDIVHTCTRLNPEERYQSVDELMLNLTLLMNPESLKHDGPSSTLKKHRWYQLPGFRSKNPFYMILASAWYLIICFLSFTLETNLTDPVQIILQNVLCFLMLMLPTLFVCNYMDVQRHVPLCQHRNLFLRWGSILVIAFLIGFFTLLLLSFILSIMGI